ncbi:hypothetical protein BDF22DRAFT_670923 [Syncephalis plumigaleata]|nr:hypothetical protein BDF22DRAFT_670923 [Syncephalis plumigaleata]
MPSNGTATHSTVFTFNMLFSQYQLLLSLLLLLSQQWMVANANLTIISNNGTKKTYELKDLPFRSEQPYSYNGILLDDVFFIDTDCNVPSINASDPDLQRVAKIASEYPDFALFANFNFVEEWNVDQAADAISNWIQQWHAFGLPQIKLIVQYSAGDMYIMNSFGSYFKFPIHNPFIRYAPSTPIKLAGAEGIVYSENKPTKIGRYNMYYYTATNEPNSFNVYLFSTERLAYKWTLFALVCIDNDL